MKITKGEKRIVFIYVHFSILCILFALYGLAFSLVDWALHSDWSPLVFSVGTLIILSKKGYLKSEND